MLIQQLKWLKYIETNNYIKMLETKIRNCSSSKEDLKESLYDLGYLIGIQVCNDCFLYDKIIQIPMESDFNGKLLIESNNIIISTKDEYSLFASGIAKSIKCNYQGFMDFNGTRGENIFNSPIRTMELPEITNGKPIENIIIAKSIVATGCTAITLAKRAFEKYMTKKIIIISYFYSKKGVDELNVALPNADIYVNEKDDSINTNGMLYPGVGNIDLRIK